MAERTVEQMCRDLLEIAVSDGLVLPLCQNSSEISASELADMANELSKMLDDHIVQHAGIQSDLAELRKDAERSTAFLLSHPDGRLFMAFGKTATEAVLSIDADKSRIDEWTICDEKDYGKPIDMQIMTAFFGPR